MEEVGSLAYRYLSSERTDPYRQGDRPTSTFSIETMAAIKKYNNVSDCMGRADTDLQKLDLAAFEMDSVENNDALQVCLFRIFNSLKTVEGVYDWLTLKGFTVRVGKSSLGDRPVIWGSLGGAQTEKNILLGGLVSRTLTSIFVQGQSVSVIWSDEYDIEEVVFSSTTK